MIDKTRDATVQGRMDDIYIVDILRKTRNYNIGLSL